MALITLILSLAIIANFGLGITVFFTNIKRKTNQAFLLSTIIMLLWLAINLHILHLNTLHNALLYINIASAISSCLPSLFQLLRLTIKFSDVTWVALIRKCFLQIVLNILIVFIIFSPQFTISVTLHEVDQGPSFMEPKYGPLFILFMLYFIGSLIVLGINLLKDRKVLEGSKRLESEFLVFACLSGLAIGIIGTFFVILFNSSSAVPIANAISVVTVSIIVAYGISVHRILSVSTLLRKASAHSLVIVFLIFVYYSIWLSGKYICSSLGVSSLIPVHIIASVAVAYTMLPARNKFQKATDLLFSKTQTFDVQKTIKQADQTFQSVTTINDINDQFATLLIHTFSCQGVTILSEKDGQFIQTFSTSKDRLPISLAYSHSIVSRVKSSVDSINVESLLRARETTELLEIRDFCMQQHFFMVTGIFSKSKLKGLVCLGKRKRGSIYDKIEQDTLQILCNQFAVALENARLYTAMQDSKIQNEIMLDQLASGVVVAGPDRGITLFNHEAQKITGINEAQAIGENIAVLPREIHLALEVTLENENGVRNIDATIYPDEDSEDFPKYIRMSSAFLLGHDGKPMGALLVITDITELKALEEQVRRSDQLSSVGTLAAGMAHEIKNPLVTIKTFTQLLPRRYSDEDFRKDFSSLVAHEVERIDGIVNELLSFSKPAKPHLIAMDIQDTVDQTLKLIHEQLSQNNIKLQNNCKADKSHILGDAKLLSQAFINLALNAIDAIGENGTLTVGTINCAYRFANGDSPDRAVTRKCIRIQITDNGKGIARENLQKIFDPFFTSKSEGTGMGLSVAHGIISEHHGVIEVDSELGKGTTFYLYMPLLEEEVA